ncbi:MAG: hypothetical protein IJM59_02835 [Proteobacteria bacterium]|nr:hypothetical protein [Pseudomonadota bacterium]
MFSGLAVYMPDAEALSLQEIIVMSGQGLSDDVLITIISSADALPELSQEDYGTLEKSGISPRVIEAIEQRRKAIQDASQPEPANPQSPDTSESAPDASELPDAAANAADQPAASPEESPAAPVNPASTDETAPAGNTETETAPAGNTETETASAENTETEKTSAAAPEVLTPIVGDSTVLAPLESSNVPLVFRKFFEEAYETYTVQAEVARRYARLQNETASERAYDSEVPKVIGYIQKIPVNPVGSLESCLALSETINPPLDTPLGATLSQCIGLALNELKAPAMAAVYLDQALQSKAKLRDFAPTLTTFLSVAHDTDYTSTSPMLINEHFGDVQTENKPEFLYFTGYSLVYGPSPDPALANQILSNIPKGTIYYARARFLMAVLAVRAPEFKFRTAAEYLNQVLDAVKESDVPAAYEIQNAAWLALARIAYENHAYSAADAFYRKVDINSHHLRDAIVENAWGHLFNNEHAQVLSLTHALRAPIFEKSWIPDLLLLEAGAYLGLCRYDMASRSLETLRTTTIADGTALKAYMAQTPARDYYNQIIKHAEAPENSPIPHSIYKRVLADSTFKMLHHSIRLLTDERQKLNQHVGPSFASWPKLRAVYDEAIAQRQQFMVTVISGIYDSVLSQLHALDISASQVAIEIRLAQRQREAECLKIVASGGQCASPESAPAASALQKRGNEAYWTFDGEFWRDEIMSYVSGVTSLCGD